MHINNLSLNIKKTKYMLFTLRKKPRSREDIFIDHEPIEKVEHFKFLGVIIDSKLSWVDHIQFMKKKISKGLGILCNAKRVLKLPALLTLYYSFIYPSMLYCIEIWGFASKECLMSILRLQKHAVYIIKSVPIWTESVPMFQSLELLTVFEIYTFKIAMCMYKYVHNQVADWVNELFPRTYEIHNRVTSQSDQFYIPFSWPSTVCKSMRFKVPLIWNSIFDDVDVFCCIGTFNSHLKKYLLPRVLSV